MPQERLRRMVLAAAAASTLSMSSVIAIAQPTEAAKGVPDEVAGTLPRLDKAPAPISTEWSARDWATLVAAFGGPLGLIGALVAVWVGQSNTRATIAAAERNAEAATMQKANEAELAMIGRTLDAFYGPFLQISEANALVYGELRARQSNPAEFVLLTALLDADWTKELGTTDRTLVEEIVRNDTALEVLIREKAGLVETKVMPYLARASAHYRMLQLAHTGALGTDPDRIERYRYPWQLDRVLKAEIDRLQRRCEKLRRAPVAQPGPIEPLAIDAELSLDSWPMPLRSGQPENVTGA